MSDENNTMTGEQFAECYEIAQRSTREALKKYDASGIDRTKLSLENETGEGFIRYRLYHLGSDETRVLIASTKIQLDTLEANTTIRNLNKKL